MGAVGNVLLPGQTMLSTRALEMEASKLESGEQRLRKSRQEKAEEGTFVGSTVPSCCVLFFFLLS